MSCARQRLAEP